MVDYSLDFREKGQVDGLSFAGFCKWCTSNNNGSKLRMLDWLKVLGDLWLQRMGLAKHADDPQDHHHPDACKQPHPGRAHPQHHSHAPARSKFQVTKIPMLAQEFHRLGRLFNTVVRFRLIVCAFLTMQWCKRCRRRRS